MEWGGLAGENKVSKQISAKTKKNRRKMLMELQQKISLENNKKYIGSSLKCIVEGYDDNNNVILNNYIKIL